MCEACGELYKQYVNHREAIVYQTRYIKNFQSQMDMDHETTDYKLTKIQINLLSMHLVKWFIMAVKSRAKDSLKDI